MCEIFRLDDYRATERGLVQHEQAIAGVEPLAAARQRAQVNAMFAAWRTRIDNERKEIAG